MFAYSKATVAGYPAIYDALSGMVAPYATVEQRDRELHQLRHAGRLTSTISWAPSPLVVESELDAAEMRLRHVLWHFTARDSDDLTVMQVVCDTCDDPEEAILCDIEHEDTLTTLIGIAISHWQDRHPDVDPARS